MIWKFGTRSEQNLYNVHPNLARVVRRALKFANKDFGVIDGLRSIEVQRSHVMSRKSRTMNSRHLHGCAVDLAVYVDGKIVWEPEDVYEELARTMFQAAHVEGLVIEWGGHFGRFEQGRYKPFLDLVHFQLPKVTHPDDEEIVQAMLANF